MSIRIILADDHKIFREGLRTLIEKSAGMEVIAEADNGRAAVRLALSLKPDVVVMDVAMPDLNGVEATRQIMSEVSAVKVLVLSMHSDKRYILEMFRAGAAGYLLKDCAFEEFTTAVVSILGGKTYLSASINKIVIEDCIQLIGRGDDPYSSGLSLREREVLQCLAEGYATAQIAERLNISIKTVETHRQHIMTKLNLRSIAELTKYAISEGLTSLHV